MFYYTIKTFIKVLSITQNRLNSFLSYYKISSNLHFFSKKSHKEMWVIDFPSFTFSPLNNCAACTGYVIIETLYNVGKSQ